jgi:hypothetical protein
VFSADPQGYSHRRPGSITPSLLAPSISRESKL